MHIYKFLILLMISLSSCTLKPGKSHLHVTVKTANTVVKDAKVELWKTVADENPVKLQETTSDVKGHAEFSSVSELDSGFYYLVSKGGMASGRNIAKYFGLAVVADLKSRDVVINELTTVGSMWPVAAMFDSNMHIKGTKVGLKIGSMHTKNLVDVASGEFAELVTNGDNLTFHETVSRMNVLAALMSTCSKEGMESYCDKFLAISNSSNTLESLSNIAKSPYLSPKALYELFVSAFPYSKGSELRPTSFQPYLEWEPKDFALIVRITGGGIYSAGRMMFDNRGQLWSGQNWMPGTQANLAHSIGGGVVRLDQQGKPVSPALSGYNRQGLDGIGWGTTVSKDKVWVSSFNSKVGVLDLDGKVLGPAVVNGKNGALQGLATSRSGDVWIADNQMNQLIKFPGGDHTKGEIVKVEGLKRPFAIAVDNQDRVWVTNNGSVTVTMFPASNPKEAKQIKLGAIGPRGLAIDSKGFVWVGNNYSLGYPLPKVPKGASIIEEFRINIKKGIENRKKGFTHTGNMSLISPEGKLVKTKILEGKVQTTWGVSVDGYDRVFAANFMGTGFAIVCGSQEDHCPEGKKTGDMIHMFQSGVLQMATDIMVDEAGNAWLANNWEMIEPLLSPDPARPTSTRGGGTGLAVIYGVAKPVINPLLGGPRFPKK